MYKELVINADGPEIRVALLENGNIVELYIDRQDESNISGNIYKGRVQRVLPGMQAAFVDIGLKQAAFIYVDDVLNGRTSPRVKNFIKEDPEDEDIIGNDTADPEEIDPGQEAEPGEIEDKPPIETLILDGQDMLVQIARSPIGSKGARLTTYVSLPGRFLVLMPTVDHVGISRRITDEQERLRLKELVEGLREQQYGYIVRTAGEGVEKEVLAQEMAFLTNLWNDILEQNRTACAPSLLHQELTVTLRCVRDLLAHEADKVTIDSPVVFKSVSSFISKFMPRLKDSVTLYDGQEPVFDLYNLEVDIQRALRKKVWLKCGGYIIIENTEALVSIDVNTGRYVGKRNFEETILKTNLEALKEIAYQIRLRNLGGIIIIDFIDMEIKINQEKVYNLLKEALSKDKARTNVLPISDMGLIQMTRKRVVKALPRMLCEPCFYCEGEGMLLSKKSICYNIYRDIKRRSTDMSAHRIRLKANHVIAKLLLGEERQLISRLEDRTKADICIYPAPDFHLEQYEIVEDLR